MKRPIFIGLLVVIFVVVIIGVIRLILPESVPMAAAQERDIVETLVATGQVEPEARTILTSDVAAEVVSVEVREGDEVEEGELLVQFDEEEARATLEQAEAGVAQARAALRSVVEAGAPTAGEDAEQAQRNLEAAVEDYERAQQLFDAGVIPRVEVDEARRQVERAESDVERAQAALQETQAQGGAYAEAAAAIERAQAEATLARTRLENHRLRAPDDALVLTREVERGSFVQPGSVVATLAMDGPIKIRINPDERELARLERGQKALAISDAFPDQPFMATVSRIDPAVDPERGTITVILEVDDPPDFLRVDMTASVEVEVARRDEALVVPRQALRDLTSEEPFILKVVDGRARQISVETGISDDRFVEIVDGLSPGDVVIVDTNVAPGDRVRRDDNNEADNEADEGANR